MKDTTITTYAEKLDTLSTIAGSVKMIIKRRGASDIEIQRALVEGINAIESLLDDMCNEMVDGDEKFAMVDDDKVCTCGCCNDPEDESNADIEADQLMDVLNFGCDDEDESDDESDEDDDDDEFDDDFIDKYYEQCLRDRNHYDLPLVPPYPYAGVHRAHGRDGVTINGKVKVIINGNVNVMNDDSSYTEHGGTSKELETRFAEIAENIEEITDDISDIFTDVSDLAEITAKNNKETGKAIGTLDDTMGRFTKGMTNLIEILKPVRSSK